MKKVHQSPKLLIANLILVQLILIQSTPLYAANQSANKPNSAAQNSSVLVQPHINPHASQAIAPQELQSIQIIGRSVLAAKHGEQAEPNAEFLKQRLQAIHKSLEKLHNENMQLHASEIKIESAVDTSKATNTPNTKQSVLIDKLKAKNSQKIEDELTQESAQLHKQVEDIRGKTPNYERGDNPEEVHDHRPRLADLTDKSQQLVAEVNQALVATGEERTRKLEQLRERLQTKSLGELLPKAEPVPTITTITHHRE